MLKLGNDEIVPLSLYILFKVVIAQKNETSDCFH